MGRATQVGRGFAAPALGLAVLLVASSGCAHEPSAGEALGAIGIATAALGAAVATNCPDEVFASDDDQPESCDYDEGDGNPEAGLPMMAIGFGLVGLGALLTAAGD